MVTPDLAGQGPTIGRLQDILACPACLHRDLRDGRQPRLAPYLFCSACGAVYPIAEGIPSFIDLAALLRVPEDRLAAWHLTQKRAAGLYRDNDPASCSHPGRRDVAAFRDFMDLRGKAVLDIGSGSFALPGYVAGAGHARFVGIDPIAPSGPAAPFDFLVALAEMIPFRRRSFDAIIVATSLDHVLDLPGSVAEIARVLRPGGEVYVWAGLFHERRGLDSARQRRVLVREKASAPRDEESAVRAHLAARRRLDESLARIDARGAELEDLLVDPYHFRHLTGEAVLAAFAAAGMVRRDELRLPATAPDWDPVCFRFVPMSSGRRLLVALRSRALAGGERARAVALRRPLAAVPSHSRDWLGGPRAGLRLLGQVAYVGWLILTSALRPRRRRKPPGDLRRVQMLTISQIDIDPRINKVARSLARAGYQIEILSFAGDGGATLRVEEVDPGVRYVRVPRDDRWARLWIVYQEAFRRVGLERPCEFVHANDLTSLTVAWLLARSKGVPLIFDAHEMWCENVMYDGREWVPMSSWVRWLARLYEGFLLRDVDLFISVSGSICDEYQRRWGVRRRPLLLANFPELSLARANPSVPTLREANDLGPDQFVTLYLGGVNALRNIENVIRAHRLLPEPCVFVVRGPGIESGRTVYEALAQELGIRHRVFFMAAVDRDDVIAGAAGADCGIVMLRNICKNFYWFYPNKFFEYMLAGLPVAVSDFPDVAAHVRRERCGVLFDPDSPESIAESLRYLYENRDEARRMGLRGRAGVLREYNWDAAVQAVVQAYQELGR